MRQRDRCPLYLYLSPPYSLFEKPTSWMRGDTQRKKERKREGVSECVCALEMSQPAALLLSSLAAAITAFVSDTSIDGTRLVRPPRHLLSSLLSMEIYLSVVGLCLCRKTAPSLSFVSSLAHFLSKYQEGCKTLRVREEEEEGRRKRAR